MRSHESVRLHRSGRRIHVAVSVSPILMPQIYVTLGINTVYLANVGLLLVSLGFLAFIHVDPST